MSWVLFLKGVMVGIGEIFFGLFLPKIFRKGIVISGREKFFSRPEKKFSRPEKIFSRPDNFFSRPENIFSRPETTRRNKPGKISQLKVINSGLKRSPCGREG